MTLSHYTPRPTLYTDDRCRHAVLLLKYWKCRHFFCSGSVGHARTDVLFFFSVRGGSHHEEIENESLTSTMRRWQKALLGDAVKWD